jgi:hypothetical protein
MKKTIFTLPELWAMPSDYQWQQDLRRTHRCYSDGRLIGRIEEESPGRYSVYHYYPGEGYEELRGDFSFAEAKRQVEVYA